MATASAEAVPFKDDNKRRKCPLCKRNLCLYYVNNDQMFLMCENYDCEFPFGYEPIQLVTDESQLVDKPQKATDEFYEYPIGGINSLKAPPILTIDADTSTNDTEDLTITNSCLSELDQPSTSKSLQSELLSVRLNIENRKRKRQKLTDVKINNNLKGIKKLSNVMIDLDTDKTKGIKNTRWLSNLKTWEQQSGELLLKEKEKEFFKEPEFAISVDPEGEMPSLGIHVTSASSKLKPGTSA